MAIPDVDRTDVARLRRDLSLEPAGLLLIGRRHLRDNNSWMHNVQALAKGPNRCTLLLHPDDAAARGVRDGDEVVVRSRVGEATPSSTASQSK